MNGNRPKTSDCSHGCQVDLTNLMDFILKKLSSDERKAVESHLNDCPACRQILEELSHVTPQSTRDLFDEAAGTSGDLKMQLPFPAELDEKIAAFRRKRDPAEGAEARHQQIQRLRERLDALVCKTRIEIDHIIATIFPVSELQPAYSAVRSPQQMVQMDIINLSGRDLDETHLRISAQKDKWIISGYPAAFIDCAGYLVVIPIADLQGVLPEWNRAVSQDMLTSFLSNDPDALTLPGVSVASGTFVSDCDDICLEFSLSSSQIRLVHATDRMAAAVLIVEK